MTETGPRRAGAVHNKFLLYSTNTNIAGGPSEASPEGPGAGPGPSGDLAQYWFIGAKYQYCGGFLPREPAPREAPQYWFTRSDPRGGKGFHNPGQAPEGAGLRPSLGAWGIYQ